MKLVFRAHALQRMFEREISSEEVREVLQSGAIIEDYPDDFPYPSRLILGFSEGRALHVVAALSLEEAEEIIITVYVPNPTEWSEDYTKRML